VRARRPGDSDRAKPDGARVGDAGRHHRGAYAIAGCAFVPPAGNGPCVTGQWIVGAVQVFSNGQPLAILSGVSICAPTGTPMVPVSAQTLVIAT
jgi:hypothetical protein